MNQMNTNENNGTNNGGTTGASIINDIIAPAEITFEGVGHTITTSQNLFPQFSGLAGEASMPVATVGHFPPIMPIPEIESIVQLTTTKYTVMQEQMQVVKTEIARRNQNQVGHPP
uniref:Uncharacterized protein n=1 Tax=Cannabis sativa TaxID=3483 RepID=A0A803P9I0_CANSA